MSTLPSSSAKFAPYNAGQTEFLTVALASLAVADIEVGAFVVVLQDEVDDAGHRVGAVHGRRTARDRLDALHGRRRNRVDVDGTERVDRHAAAAVESTRFRLAPRPRRLRVEAPGSVRRRRAATSVTSNCVTAGTNCGSWFITRLDADRHRVVEGLLVDRDDRAVRLEVAAHDARARDRDLFERTGRCVYLGVRSAISKDSGHSRCE